MALSESPWGSPWPCSSSLPDLLLSHWGLSCFSLLVWVEPSPELSSPLPSPGASYFFRGPEYWKVLDGELEAAPGYPQSTARDWLVCGEPQDEDTEAVGVDRAARPGQHGQSRSGDSYEVCSCTSHAPPLRAAATLLLLPSVLWTAARS